MVSCSHRARGLAPISTNRAAAGTVWVPPLRLSRGVSLSSRPVPARRPPRCAARVLAGRRWPGQAPGAECPDPDSHCPDRNRAETRQADTCAYCRASGDAPRSRPRWRQRIPGPRPGTSPPGSEQAADAQSRRPGRHKRPVPGRELMPHSAELKGSQTYPQQKAQQANSRSKVCFYRLLYGCERMPGAAPASLTLDRGTTDYHDHHKPTQPALGPEPSGLLLLGVETAAQRPYGKLPR
jgi:hypothetical protein